MVVGDFGLESFRFASTFHLDDAGDLQFVVGVSGRMGVSHVALDELVLVRRFVEDLEMAL